MAVLVKFAFNGPTLVGRRVVNKGVKLLGGAVVGRVDFPLPDVSYLTRDSADGVVVRGGSICLEVGEVVGSSKPGPSRARVFDFSNQLIR